MQTKLHKIDCEKGQSIIEIILAMAIFALIAAALITLSVGSFDALEGGGEQTQAEALAQEGIEAVRSIRDGAYNEMIYSQSDVGISGGEWILQGEGTIEVIGQYTRTITFDDICRDSLNDIVLCPGIYTDVHSKKVTVTVEWEARSGSLNSVVRTAYITNWDSREWIQTDWSGGVSQNIWLDITRYNLDDGNIDETTTGEIKLVSLGGGSCGTKTWTFTTPANYTYNSSDIEVTGGVAQLVDSGGGGASGSTLNSGFNTDSSNWSFTSWLVSGGVTNTGNYTSSSGNPGGYVNIFIEGKKGQVLAGFWEQSFVTTADNPTTATLDLDWIVTLFNSANLNSFRVYAFVDSVSGNPTIGQEVFDSGEITSSTSWASIPQVDISSSLTTAGTYYIKFAVWVDYAGGSGSVGDQTVGFDNVVVNWSGGSGSSYSTSNPTINPTSSHTVTSIDAWSSFTETATKNGGEIYYQLSDDNGSTWQYFNGSVWATAGVSDYNTASIINANISSFDATSASIIFKSFLESDGIQQVQLDQVSIGCSQYYNWPFTTPSRYTYDSGKIEVVGGFAQLIASGGGAINGISNNVIDRSIYEMANGDESHFINISEDIFAVVYSGINNNGFIKTVSIDSSGNIGSVIDTLEFDTSHNAFLPYIINVSEGFYVIGYTGPGTDGFIKTVSIDSSGNIGSVIDTLEFDQSSGRYVKLIHISGDIFAVVYQGQSSDGFIKTVEIDINGYINNTVIDTFEYDTAKGTAPDIIHISGDVYAIAYQGSRSDGFIKTVSIDNVGNISPTIIDSFEFDTSSCDWPDIIHISGDVYAVVYQGVYSDGFIKTIEISPTGNITNSIIDFLEYDTSWGDLASIIHASENYYLIAYRKYDGDGFVVLVDIDFSGNIVSIVDTLEFDTANADYPEILSLGGNLFAIAYQGDHARGMIVTIELSMSNPSYPTDRPTINPTVSYDVTGIDTWSSFTETATKNGGEVYYQLSSDNGSNWEYWNGSSWTTAGASNYNTASIVNSNISTFTTSNQQIMFKAFLESDGSQQVQLDNIRVGWGESGGAGGYATSGYFISSAYDMGDASPVQIIEWDETIPSCTPTCEIKLQVDVAPDSSGSPGTWVGWHGETGAGTYFTVSEGALIPLALNGNSWVRYRAELIGDGVDTPVLNEVRINYK